MPSRRRNGLALTISTTLTRALSAKDGYTRAHLADALEIADDPRAVGHWLSPTLHRAVPAYLIPKICTELGNYEVLDQLEEAAGRTIVVIPPAKEDLRTLLKPLEKIYNATIVLIPNVSHAANQHDLQAVQKLVREVGSALESLGKTLEDGKVESHELEETLPRLKAVIDVCVNLKHWLEVRCETDKGRC